MCRVCYGPSLSCAEFAMCRVVPKSSQLLCIDVLKLREYILIRNSEKDLFIIFNFI